MPPAVASPPRLLTCERSSLVGHSSLMLLVAIAAIALLGHPDTGSEYSSRGSTPVGHPDRR
jgi:hypothetical protein